MMIRAGLPAATMRRVASMPSTPGMRTSISTTSGDVASTTATASPPSLGLADNLDVVAGVEDHAEPCPHQRLIVGDDDSDGHGTESKRSSACTR